MLGLAGRSARSASHRTLAVVAGVLMLVLALLPQSALAQSFPELSGRVVDAANVIPPDEEARLTQKLQALEDQTKRQLVVATIPDLQGYDIADYGYQLGRKWGIGYKERNDGAILIVAPNDRRLRVEVGYGLEGVLTDGLSSLIIQQKIVPKFKAGDLAGGIEDGTDALISQLSLPEDQARANVAAAQQRAQQADESIPFSTIIWLLIFFFFFILPMIRAMRGGRRYRSGIGPVVIWPGGSWGGGGGSDWGGGGGFGGGGFSGGGGSFGGGGASGSW